MTFRLKLGRWKESSGVKKRAKTEDSAMAKTLRGADLGIFKDCRWVPVADPGRSKVSKINKSQGVYDPIGQGNAVNSVGNHE